MCYRQGMEDTDVRVVVKTALAEQGLTFTSLASELGTHKSTLSRLVGEAQPVSSRSLWPRILDRLGVEVVYRLKEPRP